MAGTAADDRSAESRRILDQVLSIGSYPGEPETQGGGRRVLVAGLIVATLLVSAVSPIGAPARAQFVYDIRSFGGMGIARMWLNGKSVGELRPASSVPSAVLTEWVHRSIDIDPAKLIAGTNTVRIELEGTVQLDRLQMELAYTSSGRQRSMKRR